jgi:hypothetical protein
MVRGESYKVLLQLHGTVLLLQSMGWTNTKL